MRLKAMAVWGWTGLILVGWSIISAINPGELTTFGIPAALTLILGSHIWSRAEGIASGY